MKVIPGEGNKKTLLEQAQAVPVARRASRALKHEEVELAVAWYRGDVSTKQVAVALGITDASVASRMQTLIRNGIGLQLLKLVVAADE